MSHSETVELLPWLVNRTLSDEEENQVRQQLHASEQLRRELRDAVETARLLGTPPSVEALVDFASGRPTAEAELIEGLIETLPEWAEQVQLARRSFALQDESIALLGGRRPASSPPPSAKPRSVPGYWRPLAIAASLAAVVSLAGWLSFWLSGWQPGPAPSTTATVSTPWLAKPQATAPQPNVTVLDLVASSFIRRDGAGETNRQNVRLSELGDSLVLILASDSDRVFERYELELVGPGGTSSTPELVRTPQHDYTLLVPRSLLVPGNYTIHVYGRTAAQGQSADHEPLDREPLDREPLESYELRVEP